MISENSQLIIRIANMNVTRMANALKNLVNTLEFISLSKFRKLFEKGPNEFVM